MEVRHFITRKLLNFSANNNSEASFLTSNIRSRKLSVFRIVSQNFEILSLTRIHCYKLISGQRISQSSRNPLCYEIKLYEDRFGFIVNYVVRDALSYAIHKSSRCNKRHRDESFPLTMCQAGSNYNLKKFSTIPHPSSYLIPCTGMLVSNRAHLSNYTFRISL